MLVFSGPDAVTRIMNVVGHIVHERTSAETIRDTYGDYIVDAAGNVTYFEPAVLAAPTRGGGRERVEALGVVFGHRRRRARRRDPVPGRREGGKNARAHQAGQLPFSQRAARRRDRPVFAHGAEHHLLPRAAHERRAGGGVLRPGAGGARRTSSRSRAARGPAGPREGDGVPDLRRRRTAARRIARADQRAQQLGRPSSSS